MKETSVIHSGQDSAMTEIALALAMGFFSLMVLTLVSMGSGETQDAQETKFASIVLADETQPTSGMAEPADNDVFIIHWAESFYDRDGSAVNPTEVGVPDNGRIVLVVDPKSSFTDVMRARRALTGDRVIVAEMDKAWMEAMRARGEQP